MSEQTQIQPQLPATSPMPRIITPADIPSTDAHDPSLHEERIRTAPTEEEMRQRFHDRWTPRFKKVMVGLGMYGVIASGGLIDKGMDVAQDANSHVHEVLEDAVPSALPPEEIDGFLFSEYPADAQADIAHDYTAGHDAVSRAVAAVAQTMGDLDSHKTERIVSRAERFKDAHSAEFLSDDVAEQAHQQITDAKSHEEVVAALNIAVSFYGKSVELDPSMNELQDTTLKDNAHAVLNVLSVLPKSLVGEARFSTIQFASLDSMKDHEVHGGMVAGYYSSLDETISIGIAHTVGEHLIVKSNQHGPKALGGGSSPEDIFAHELGHAFQALPDYGDIHPAESLDDADLDTVAMHSARDILQIPEHQSLYGATGGVHEDTAESFAAILNRGKGIVHPDEARRFGSGANTTTLRSLTWLETRHPGITDYIVSLKDEVLGRQVFEIGS